jgi:DNA-binding XRE family transcriptional regulator
MDVNMKELGRRVREAREAAGASQNDAAKAIEVSQPTYYRIENGDRPLKGDELIQLADLFGIRAAAMTGLAEVRERAHFAARTDGGSSPMATMRERLYAYLELDSYLTSQGIPGE